MKPYLSPRRTGIDRLDIYMDGYAQYLRDCGETRLSMTPFDGTEPYEAAKEAIMRQIDKGYPFRRSYSIIAIRRFGITSGTGF